MKYNETIIEDIIIKNLLTNDINFKRQYEIIGGSKSKSNYKGYVDFFFVFDGIQVIIECKKDIKYHRSSESNSEKNYAFNGVIFYAEKILLDNEHINEILAIASSGNESEQLHTLVLLKKDNSTITSTEIDTFNSFDLIIDNYFKNKNMLDKIVFPDNDLNNSFEDIDSGANHINELMHEAGLTELQRPLLLSALLLSMKELEPQELNSKNRDVSKMLDIVDEVLTNSDIPTPKVKHLMTNFNSLKGETGLELISDNGMSIVKTIFLQLSKLKKKYHTFDFDFLGHFYHKFLHYSPLDTSTQDGITLTPPHIVQIMTDLLSLSENSTVLDPCSGSAAFLISSMQKLLTIVSLNYEKIEERTQKILNIKANSLYGIERNSLMYLLSITNMIIKGDGKSNITHDDFFNWQRVKKTSHGIMNPPYFSKKGQKKPIEFIYRLLNSVSHRAVVIVPVSSFKNTKGNDVKMLKKEILEKHDIEAIITMPKDLFEGNSASTETCIIVININQSYKKKTKLFSYDDHFYVNNNKRSLRPNYSYDNIINDFWTSYDDINTYGLSVELDIDEDWNYAHYLLKNKKVDNEEFRKLYEKKINEYILFQLSEELYGK